MQNSKVKEAKKCFSEPTEKNKKRGISLSKHWICAYKFHLLGSALNPIKTNKLYTKLYLKQKNWVFTGKSLMNTQYGARDGTWRAGQLIKPTKSMISFKEQSPAEKKNKYFHKPLKKLKLIP